MDQELNVAYYMSVLKRRRASVLLPSVITFVILVAVIILLPSIYKSTATILIEAQEIPQELVKTTVTGYIEERLQTMTQVVLSRKNLLDIISKYKLYTDLSAAYTTEEIIDKMRRDITLEPVTAEVVNPQSGRPSTATIAFTLSYEGKDPTVVTQVASTLVSLYMESNLKNREERTQTTYEFLEGQLNDLGQEINAIESRIAAFKDKNIYSLPELMELNMTSMERSQKELDATLEQIRMLQDRKLYLEGQLATLEPIKYTVTTEGGRALTPEEELKSMKSRYISLKAALSEKHPDVVRLKNQIDALGSEIGSNQSLRDRAKELADKQTQLEVLSKKYSDMHPDVIRLRKEVDKLGAEVSTMSAAKPFLASEKLDQPDNPAYISLKTQIAQADLEISKTLKVASELRIKSEDYQRRIEQTPRVEQEYKALLRDYNNAQAKYQDTKARLQAAKEAKGLEENRMAERLTVIDPPIRPEQPYKPNRLLLLALGLILSVGVGAAVGTAAELSDSSIHSAQDLAAMSSKPILTVVPFVETSLDRALRLKRRVVWSVSSLAALGACLLLTHVFFRPLDVIWFQVMRKISYML